MQFVKAEDTEYQFERMVSTCGKIELYIYPVMFGYRVRAGFVDMEFAEIDWCGGDSQSKVELLYSMAKNILENKGSFSGIPSYSKIKPFYNDKEFMDCITALTVQPFEVVNLSSLSLIRAKFLNKIFQHK